MAPMARRDTEVGWLYPGNLTPQQATLEGMSTDVDVFPPTRG